MTVSIAGIRFLEALEGFRANAYLDSGGVPTIGYGWTVGVKMGDTCTQEEAEEWLIREVQKIAGFLENCVKVSLKQSQVDALASFIYNVGRGAFMNSTMLKMLNKGEFEGAANEFGKWNHVAGKVNEGLSNRRRAERILFKGDAG
jgi:lysozyme